MEITSSRSTSVSEIEEESSNDDIQIALESIEEEIELASADEDNNNNVYYVAILGGKSSSEEESSMDALVWTLNNIIPMDPSTVVYLVRVFPELHFIPTPLGKLPISRVNPEQKEKYLIQERGKRRDFLQKFLAICSASKVKVETILIESDMEAKAILDLIPILNIRKLVLGISKSNLRKLRSRKGNETADQMLQNVPEFCELNIICEGEKQVFDQDPIIEQQSPSPRPHKNNNAVIENKATTSPKLSMQEQAQMNESFTCSCFRAKALA